MRVAAAAVFVWPLCSGAGVFLEICMRVVGIRACSLMGRALGACVACALLVRARARLLNDEDLCNPLVWTTRTGAAVGAAREQARVGPERRGRQRRPHQGARYTSFHHGRLESEGLQSRFSSFTAGMGLGWSGHAFSSSKGRRAWSWWPPLMRCCCGCLQATNRWTLSTAICERFASSTEALVWPADAAACVSSFFVSE